MSKRKSKLPLSFDPGAFARANEAERQLTMEELAVTAVLQSLGVSITPKLKYKLSQVIDDRQVIGCDWLNAFMPMHVGIKRFTGGRTSATAMSQLWRITDKKATPEVLALQDLMDEDPDSRSLLITRYKDTRTFWAYSAAVHGDMYLCVPGALTDCDGEPCDMYVQRLDDILRCLAQTYNIRVPMEDL